MDQLNNTFGKRIGAQAGLLTIKKLDVVVGYEAARSPQVIEAVQAYNAKAVDDYAAYLLSTLGK